MIVQKLLFSAMGSARHCLNSSMSALRPKRRAYAQGACNRSFGGAAEYVALLQAAASVGLKTQHNCLDWLAAACWLDWL